MFQVLVVEDDDNLSKLMEAILKQNGYAPICAKDGEEALQVFDQEHIDLVISDIMMPKLDGYELTKLLRDVDPYLPILMVTAKEAYEDKKKGFLLGVDDYMVKPIDMSEMLLRITALLRRAKIVSEHKIVVGEYILDYDALSVTWRSEIMTLPPKEFYLLYKLIGYANVIFTRRQLLDEIWGMDHEVDERTVDVHIKRLRERFYDCKEFEIITVRGLGYKLVKNV
ncbi:MAG: response regulator transcription factor [bacterium]|nr:response regulator transcription factor [bacterium]